jgi:hypothetical protein
LTVKFVVETLVIPESVGDPDSPKAVAAAVAVDAVPVRLPTNPLAVTIPVAFKFVTADNSAPLTVKAPSIAVIVSVFPFI